jgi:hypothetical protein
MKPERRAPGSVRKTALWLAALAVAIYLGFILAGVIRA